MASEVSDSAAAALASRRCLGVRDAAHVLGAVQVVREFGDLGRTGVALVVAEQLVELVAGVEPAPDRIGQLGDSLPHVHASHSGTSRPEAMTRRMTFIMPLERIVEGKSV